MRNYIAPKSMSYCGRVTSMNGSAAMGSNQRLRQQKYFPQGQERQFLEAAREAERGSVRVHQIKEEDVR